MAKQTILTGITTTGTPHIGNYLGAIKPAIAASKNPANHSYFFLADYHGLIKCANPERVAQSTREIAATWLALGLDTDQATFYRQSDIPEIAELNWLLTCVAPKGLMNRAHAYKAATDANQAASNPDLDDGVNMGLYCYPILMAADILMFNADNVPVGKDQIQHIEMTRDIAQRFNHLYQPLFRLPQAQVDASTQLIPGLDGRKMSKSYDNTIPLFCSREQLLKYIKQIKTDSRLPGEPKSLENNSIYQLYCCFADENQSQQMAAQFSEGISWHDAKLALFELIDQHLSQPRQRYQELMQDLDQVESILLQGAAKARQFATPFLQSLRQATGLRPLNQQAAKAKSAETASNQTEDDAAKQARAEAGRRRAILMQLKSQLDSVHQAENPQAAARALLDEKQAQLQGLKKRARQKAENELDVLTEELASLLSDK